MTPLPRLIAREAPPPLIALGYLLSTARHMGVHPSPHVLGVGMIGAACVYGVDHYLDASRPREARRFPPAMGLVALAGAWIVWAAIRSPDVRASWALGYMALAFLYVFPSLPGKNRLQDLPRVRTLAICLGWTTLPLLAKSVHLFSPPLAFFAAWGAFLTPNVLLNDAAHAGDDRQAGRPTWAGTQPLPRLRTLCLGLLLLSIVLFGIAGPSPGHMLPPAAFALLLAARGPLPTAAWADWILCLPLIPILVHA